MLATSATTGPLDKFIAVLRRLRGVGIVQRPHDYTTTGEERTALDRGIRLVQRCWRNTGGPNPSWQEIAPFLKLLRVTTLTLEPDESDEQNAKYWLRDRILLRATAAEAAWKLLKDNAIGLAKRKAGVERAELQRMLRGADVPLRALRSYEADIDRLRGQTQTNLRALMRFSRIHYDGIEITIRREYEAIITQEADASSLVVIGDAGCGKSGLLAVFADQAQANGRHVLVLNAGELAAESLGQLRNELALEHELIDVIEHWEGEGPAFLVIDALDSAREERTAATLRLLVERVQQLEGRWRVVATIRKFDLKNGRHWQKILPGTGIRPYFDLAFDDVRHINIGLLTAADIDHLKDAAPSLHALVATAPPALAELLHVPFNLMLANELRQVGGASDLAAVTTQLGLLDLYWDRRLTGSFGERASYEATLRKTTEAMLGGRRLHVPLTAIIAGPPLETLLSRSVLVEHADRLQYAHHILFDYAVERLLLRPDENATITRLESDRDLPLAIGPSLKFWLEGLWERDPSRNVFWTVAIRPASSNAPAIAKLVPGTVAAEKTGVADDCIAMIAAISSDAGTRVFMFVADAVTASAARIARKRPNPWFFVLDRAAASAPVPVLHRGAFLLHQLLDAISDPSNEELGVIATLQVDRHVPRLRARDGEPEITKEVVQQLSRIAADPSRAAELPELVRFIARNNRTSLVWEELVESMERSAEMFLTLHELLFSKDALSLFSRRFLPVLRVHQGLLTPDARAKTERTILELHDSGYGDVTAYRLFEALGRAGLSVAALGWLDEQDKERARAAQELHGIHGIDSEEKKEMRTKGPRRTFSVKWE